MVHVDRKVSAADTKVLTDTVAERSFLHVEVFKKRHKKIYRKMRREEEERGREQRKLKETDEFLGDFDTIDYLGRKGVAACRVGRHHGGP